jgi:hypothetical protein
MDKLREGNRKRFLTFTSMDSKNKKKNPSQFVDEYGLSKRFPLTIKHYIENKGTKSIFYGSKDYLSFKFNEGQQPETLAIFELEACEDKLMNPDPIVREAREKLPEINSTDNEYWRVPLIKKGLGFDLSSYEVEFKKLYFDEEPIKWEYIRTKKG